MKYTIDEDICKRKGLKFHEVVAIMLVKTGVDISKLLQTMLEKQVLIRNIHSPNGLLVTENYDNIFSEIILSSDASIPKEEELDEIVKELREIFPSGKKEGTSVYWRGNQRDIKLKLKKFFKLYGETYTKEQVIEATKRYVSSFNGFYSYMRVLSYFIWKNVKRTDIEGNTFIEEISDLATFIEDPSNGELVKEDWTSNLN